MRKNIVSKHMTFTTGSRMASGRKVLGRATAVVLSAALTFLSIPVSIPASSASGIITIASEEDLMELSEKCSLDSFSQGKTVNLTEDLDLRGCDYKAIPSFGGIFNGNDHTISGLNYDSALTENGLFISVQKGAEIHDLKLAIKMESAEADKLGGIAARNSGLITGCEVEGRIHGHNYVGGIVGENEHDGIVEKCSSLCTIDGMTYTGGIAGENKGTITSCKNKGHINNTDEGGAIESENLQKIDFSNLMSATNAPLATDTGGIAGYSEGEIEKCENYGEIGYQHVGYNVGGIVGRQAGYLTGCNNYGKVLGRKDVGGICGQCVPCISLNFDNTNTEELKAELKKLDGYINDLKDDAGAGIGGISSSLDKMSGYITSAKTSAESLASSVSETVADTTTEVKETVSDLSNYKSGITSSVNNLKQDLTDMDASIGDCRSAIQNMTGEHKDDALAALSTIEGAVKQIRQGRDSLDQARKKLTSDPLAAARLIKSGVSDLNAGTKALKAGIDALDAVRKDIEASGEDAQAVSVIVNTVSDLRSGAKDAESQLQNLSSIASQISGNTSLPQANSGKYKKDVQGIASALGGIGESLNGTKKAVKNSSTKVIRDFERLSSEFTAIVNMFSGMVDDTLNTNFLSKDTYLADVSDAAIFSTIDGKTEKSENHGTVEADVNVGGIAGTMAVEYDMDPEDDIDVSGRTGIHFEYNTKVIVFQSRNYGKILSKKDCVGSVVGNMDVGTVYGCEAYGSAESSTGDYVGGIAGKSVSGIKKSYAKCALAGGSYVGGIAGEGENIALSCSLARIDRYDDFAGAVAGKADGDLAENYFFSENMAGVDRISYKGKAEPLSYEALCKIKDLPEEFKTMKATFIADGKEIEKVNYDYGGSIAKEDIPEIPAKTGYYGRWDIDDFDGLTLDVVATAEYKPYLTAISSAETRNNTQSVVLATGEFTDESAITIVETTDGVAGASDTYGIKIIGDSIVESVRYLPEDGKDCTLYMKTDGNWEELSTSDFGVYKSFETDKKEFSLSVVMKSEINIKLIAIIAGSCVVVMILLIVLIKHAKRRKSKG